MKSNFIIANYLYYSRLSSFLVVSYRVGSDRKFLGDKFLFRLSEKKTKRRRKITIKIIILVNLYPYKSLVIIKIYILLTKLKEKIFYFSIPASF